MSYDFDREMGLAERQEAREVAGRGQKLARLLILERELNVVKYALEDVISKVHEFAAEEI